MSIVIEKRRRAEMVRRREMGHALVSGDNSTTQVLGSQLGLKHRNETAGATCWEMRACLIRWVFCVCVWGTLQGEPLTNTKTGKDTADGEHSERVGSGRVDGRLEGDTDAEEEEEANDTVATAEFVTEGVSSQSTLHKMKCV